MRLWLFSSNWTGRSLSPLVERASQGPLYKGHSASGSPGQEAGSPVCGFPLKSMCERSGQQGTLASGQESGPRVHVLKFIVP